MKFFKRFQTKGFVAGFTLCALLFSSVLVLASTQTVTREVTYGIGVVFNGQQVQFDYDSRPFVMDGRTFLPLRTMADLVGLSVDFDPVANNAILFDYNAILHDYDPYGLNGEWRATYVYEWDSDWVVLSWMTIREAGYVNDLYFRFRGRNFKEHNGAGDYATGTFFVAGNQIGRIYTGEIQSAYLGAHYMYFYKDGDMLTINNRIRFIRAR